MRHPSYPTNRIRTFRLTKSPIPCPMIPSTSMRSSTTSWRLDSCGFSKIFEGSSWNGISNSTWTQLEKQKYEKIADSSLSPVDGQCQHTSKRTLSNPIKNALPWWQVSSTWNSTWKLNLEIQLENSTRKDVWNWYRNNEGSAIVRRSIGLFQVENFPVEESVFESHCNTIIISTWDFNLNRSEFMWISSKLRWNFIWIWELMIKSLAAWLRHYDWKFERVHLSERSISRMEDQRKWDDRMIGWSEARSPHNFTPNSLSCFKHLFTDVQVLPCPIKLERSRLSPVEMLELEKRHAW